MPKKTSKERDSFVIKQPSGAISLVRDTVETAVCEFLHAANLPQSKGHDVHKALKETNHYAAYGSLKEVRRVADNMPMPVRRPYVISRVIVPTLYDVEGAT